MISEMKINGKGINLITGEWNIGDNDYISETVDRFFVPYEDYNSNNKEEKEGNKMEINRCLVKKYFESAYTRLCNIKNEEVEELYKNDKKYNELNKLIEKFKEDVAELETDDNLAYTATLPTMIINYDATRKFRNIVEEKYEKIHNDIENLEEEIDMHLDMMEDDPTCNYESVCAFLRGMGIIDLRGRLLEYPIKKITSETETKVSDVKPSTYNKRGRKPKNK